MSNISINLQMTKAVWLSTLPKGCNKLVLLAMCHHFNDLKKLSWPSVGRLALMCGMSERTVQNHIRTLQRVGILVPRLVRTGFSTRYAIQLAGLPLIVFPSFGAPADALPEDDEPVDNFDLTPAEFAPPVTEIGTTPPQISTDTPAESAPELSLTANTTVNRTADPALPDSVMLLDDVNPQVLKDFTAIRAKKKLGALNATALEALCVQAVIACMTLEQVLQTCCTRNWGRFEAAWLADKRPSPADVARTTVPAPPAGPPPEPVKLAAPEVREAALAAYRAKLSPALPAKPAAPAMPAGANDIRIAADAPPWAVGIVDKVRSGQHVNRTALHNACAALKISPASLRGAGAVH